VRHLKALPLRMPYWLTLRLVRLASPFLVAGMVALSPTSSVPIGYVIGLGIIVFPCFNHGVSVSIRFFSYTLS